MIYVEYEKLKKSYNDTQKNFLEKIRGQLDEAENILHKRLLLIREKEKELRMSRKTDDMVYVLRFLERMRIEDIADQMCYSVGAINKYLKKIRDNIKECTKL